MEEEDFWLEAFCRRKRVFSKCKAPLRKYASDFSELFRNRSEAL